MEGICHKCNNSGASTRKVMTPLMWSAACGHYRCVDVHIKSGVDVNEENSTGITALHCAAVGSKKNLGDSLMKTIPGLNLGIEKGDVSLITELLKRNVEALNRSNVKGAGVNNAAFDDISSTEDIDYGMCLELLIAAGADVNQASKDGTTVLMLVTENDNDKLVHRLIKAGANINQRDSKGNTALRGSSQCPSDRCFDLLIQAGADVNIVNNKGITSLMCEAEYGNEVRLIKLIDAGADVNRESNIGKTALMAAADNGHSKCVELLIEAGADVNNNNSRELTALARAARQGDSTSMDILTQAGADVNKASFKGVTPLMMAAQSGIAAHVLGLLEVGADVNMTDDNGVNCLKYALVNRHMDVYRILQTAQFDSMEETKPMGEGAKVNKVFEYEPTALGQPTMTTTTTSKVNETLEIEPAPLSQMTTTKTSTTPDPRVLMTTNRTRICLGVVIAAVIIVLLVIILAVALTVEKSYYH